MESAMPRKRVTISSKNQITLPKQFCNLTNISREVEIFVDKGRIIIEPVKTSGLYFSEEILSDLIDQGFSGDELKTKFSQQIAAVEKALSKLSAEVDTDMKSPQKLSTMEDVFGE